MTVPAAWQYHGNPWHPNSLSNVKCGAVQDFWHGHRFVAMHSGSMTGIKLFWQFHPTPYLYSAGDGGLMEIELWPVDGGGLLPDYTGGVPLAELSTPHVMDLVDGYNPIPASTADRFAHAFVEHTWSTPFTLVQGTRYVVTVKNVHANVTDNFTSVNHTMSHLADRKDAANSPYTPATADWGLLSAYGKATPLTENTYRETFGGTGSHYFVHMQIRMATAALNFGNSYMQFADTNTVDVTATDWVRQRWTPVASHTVDGLSVWTHNAGTIRGRLYRAGSLVYTGTAATSSGDWAWVTLTPAPALTIDAGVEYRLEFDSTSGSLETDWFRSGTASLGANSYGDGGNWGGGFAEVSTNSGSTWTKAWEEVTDLMAVFREPGVGSIPPSGSVTSPTQDVRLAYTSTAGVTVTGTATDDGTVTNVEVDVDSGGFAAATNTGTNFSTWSYNTGALTVGAHTIDVRITDDDSNITNLVTRDFVVNAVPAVSAYDITGITEGQVLPANDPMPSFTVNNVTDDFGNIDAYSYFLVRGSDGFHWNDSTELWQAGGIGNTSSTGQNDSTPATHTFADGVDGTELPQDLGVGESYALLVQARDSDLDWGPLPVSTQRNFYTSPGTYFVSAATGDDVDDGLTTGNAFATIQHAIDTAGSDSTIKIMPDGVYTERLVITGINNITIESNTPGTRWAWRPEGTGTEPDVNGLLIDGALGTVTHDISIRDFYGDFSDLLSNASGVVFVRNAYDSDCTNCVGFGAPLNNFATSWYYPDQTLTSGCDGIMFVDCIAISNQGTSSYGGSGFSFFAMTNIAQSTRNYCGVLRCRAIDHKDIAADPTGDWDGSAFIFDVSNYGGDLVIQDCMTWGNRGRAFDIYQITPTAGTPTLYVLFNTTYRDGSTHYVGDAYTAANGVVDNRYHVGHNQSAIDLVAHGNIFEATGCTRGYWTHVTAPALNSTTVEYNNLFPATGSNSDWGGIGGTGGTGNITTDPQLDNPGTPAMAPGAASPVHNSQSPTKPPTISAPMIITDWGGTANGIDINGNARDATNPTWGAIESAAGTGPTGESPVLFAITSPPDLSTNVASPQTPAGTAPDDGGTGYQIRFENVTQGEVWNGSAFIVDPGGDTHWQPATFTAGTETWLADAATTYGASGDTYRVQKRRTV